MDGPMDWRRRVRPTESAIFLDVDGTLLGFKDRPEDVVADDPLRRLLGELHAATGGAVAFVSGRAISDIDRIMQPLVWPAAGVHGAELRFADGTRRDIAADALHELRGDAEAFVAARPGLRLEAKGGTTFAIHFRQAPERADEVHGFLDRLVTSDDVMVQHGKMVAEVKPRSCNKGAAIKALLDTVPFKDRRPVFIGDDLTDEYGFAQVNSSGGISVKVGDGSEKSVALQRLEDISAVRTFLELICRSDRLD